MEMRDRSGATVGQLRTLFKGSYSETMEGLFIALVIGFIILMVIEFIGQTMHIWLPFAVLISVVAAAFWALNFARKQAAEANAEKRRAAEARKQADIRRGQEKRAQEERKKLEISHAFNRISNSLQQANILVEAIPGHLLGSEESLSIAIEKIKRRSFYPFWDSIGDSVSHLDKYRESIHRIEQLRVEYARNLTDYKEKVVGSDMRPVETFPITQVALPILREGSETASRIDALYEIAHSDYEFSNIYANWRTNKTLVAGFENLSSGLHALRDDLSTINFTLIDGFDSTNASISDAAASIGSKLSSLSDAINSNSDRIEQKMVESSIEVSRISSANAVEMRDEYRRVGDASSAQQDRMIGLLKNIMRGREDIPGGFEIGYLSGTRPKQ